MANIHTNKLRNTRAKLRRGQMKEIAERLGLSNWTVYNVLRGRVYNAEVINAATRMAQKNIAQVNLLNKKLAAKKRSK